MSKRVFNFGAGPAQLPTPVMEQIQEEFLDYQGMGTSVIEISHRSKEFGRIIDGCDDLLRELTGLPDRYKIAYVHGGARMQFAAIPLNLINRTGSGRAQYIVSGNFSKIAAKDAERFGQVDILANGEESGYRRIPQVDPAAVDQDAAYVHLTLNNTIFGTRFQELPDTGAVPLVADCTSEILSRELDYSRFGMVYAGFQKNLGPSGLALVIIRDDLIGHARPETPILLDYKNHVENHSLTNTTNTFALYVLGLVLQWLKDEGGVAAMEKVNNEKAALLYDVLDRSDFYQAFAAPEDRSVMNVTFNLPNDDTQSRFLEQALEAGLYALKGHRSVGGIRASIYNPMPRAGVQALADFMTEFERRNG